MKAACLLAVLLLLAWPLGASPYHPFSVRTGDGLFVAGNPAPVPARTEFGAALCGGGGEFDEAFRWMIDRCGGGDFVVLRATDDDVYNDDIFALGRIDSVETLVVRSRHTAFDASVVQRVREADAIFLAGGDQSRYIRYWKDTPLLKAVQRRIESGVPIGGTSAGLAVLGQASFAALRDTVTSEQALRHPVSPLVTLETEFLHVPFLQRVITDSHFAERNRMGRLMAFLANLPGYRGMGVDEKTALLIDAQGRGRVVGPGSVYILQPTQAAESCDAVNPLTLRGVDTLCLDRSSEIDLKTWRSRGTRAYRLDAVNGDMRSTQPGGKLY